MKIRKIKIYSLSGIGVALFVLALIFCSCSSQVPEESLSLTILHTNDHHGHTLTYAHNEIDVGGRAERIHLIKKLKEQAISTSDICLLLDAGDVLNSFSFKSYY